jgi:hypothetical protein
MSSVALQPKEQERELLVDILLTFKSVVSCLKKLKTLLLEWSLLREMVNIQC